MSTFTNSLSLELVARGDDVGTWDTPTNSNWSVVDAAVGGVTSVALTNSNVTLSSAQYQNNFINLTGAISANIAITLPAVGRFYTFQNLTTNTSAFYITLTTTAAGGQAIGLPPGNPTSIFTDGTNVKFSGLPNVGSFWDYGGSSVPSWLSACTVPPWLNCDGTAFSSATYPVLATILSTTVVPDSKGRFRATLNQGTTRLTSTGANLDGNTRGAGGGQANVTIGSSNITQFNSGQTTPTWTATGSFPFGVAAAGANTWPSGPDRGLGAMTGTVSSHSHTVGSTAAEGAPSVPPSYVGGLTLIRAA